MDAVYEVLAKPAGSAPGPDGLPSSLYSCLKDIAAPIILEIIIALCDGVSPPKSFDLGDLCLFPEEDSALISRTRPITLNNYENRIIASVVSRTLMPVVDWLAELRQKGFIKGRKGEENIKEVTDSFYKALLAQQQHFYLFIDTAKAFDSIDHDFLFDVLDKVGMPAWVANIVQGLMHDVQVRPRLGPGQNKARINIERGVKQGCPLSPLLFILAYDPLLTRLATIPGTDVWAFADDAVIGNKSMHHMTHITAEIDAFGEVSGFGVNRDKSSILHTMPPTDQHHTHLTNIGWEGLSFTTSATYLGILLGVGIGNDDVYRASYTKFEKRLKTHSAALKHLNLQARVHLFNIYILPLFSYLHNFYIMPDSDEHGKGMGEKIRAHIQKHVVSFHGTAHKYMHLVSRKHSLGLAQPIRDPWAANMAALASQFDFASIQPCRFAMVPGKHYINADDARCPAQHDPREWNTMLIDDHITCAALELLNDHTPRTLDNIIITETYDVSRYKHKRKTLRKRIYNQFRKHYQDEQIDDITLKLIKRGMTQGNERADDHTHTYALLDNCEDLLPSLPHAVHNHHRLIIFNALATDRRRASANMLVPVRGPAGNPHPCYFCGKGPDHLTHIYRDCRIVRAARRDFGTAIGLELGHEPEDYGLSRPRATPSPPSHVSERTANATLIFNWCAWDTRRTHFTQTNHYEPLPPAAARITKHAISTWNSTVKPRWQTTITGQPPDPALLGPSPYGSASKRSDAQKAAARSFGARKLADIHPSHYIAYTDGSSKGNSTTKRSPSGAGACLQLPRRGGTRREVEDFAALGSNTNNFGELWGIGMALELFLGRARPGDTLHILSDSSYATLAVTRARPPASNKALARAVRKLYRTTLTHHHIHVEWVPAHVGIEGNEHADQLADEGARQSDQGRYIRLPDILARIQACNFVAHPKAHRLATTRPAPAPQAPARGTKRAASDSAQDQRSKRSRLTQTAYKQTRLSFSKIQ